MSTLTIPLDPATEAALEEIAIAAKRPKAEIAADVVADFVRDRDDYSELVRQAREDFAAGRTFTPEAVAAGARAIISGARTRQP
jgi:predicted transcriptional regulator